MKSGNCGAKCPILNGSIKRVVLQINYRYSAETFRIYSRVIEIQTCVDTRSDLMRVSHNGTSNLNILEISKHF